MPKVSDLSNPRPFPPPFNCISEANLFTVSNSNMDWLLRPALIDDSSSDTSGSFRSPSREISPFMIPDTTPSCETPFTHTITSLVRSVDRGGMSTRTKPTDSNFGFLPLTEAPFFYQPHGSLPWYVNLLSFGLTAQFTFHLNRPPTS